MSSCKRIRLVNLAVKKRKLEQEVTFNDDLFSLIVVHLNIKYILKIIVLTCQSWYNILKNQHHITEL